MWQGVVSHRDFKPLLKTFEDQTAALKEDSKMKPLLTAINNAYTMQEHGTQYKRLLRQLISLLADPSSGLARGKVHAMITGSGTDVTFAAIKQARKSARDNGAGMPAPKQEFSRI